MKKIRLSPVDHLFTGTGAYPIEFLIKYPNRLDQKTLQKSLNRIVSLFWPLFGRIKNNKSKTFNLSWNGEKAKLGMTDLTNNPMPDFKDPKTLSQFSLPVESVPEKPLSAFHLYQLKEGSALVVNLSHCIVDGYSYFYFLSQWANLSRKFSFKNLMERLLFRPNHNRELLTPPTFPKEPVLKEEECFETTGSTFSQEKRTFGWEDCQWEFYEFLIDDINREKEKINLLHKSGSKKKLSSNDILCAMLLKKLVEEGRFFKEKARISSAFDYRRVLPKLGPKYFGNAVRAASFDIPTSEIQKSNLQDLALKFRKTTDSITIEKAWDSLAYFEGARLSNQGGFDFIQSMHVSDPSCGLLITNLSRAPLPKLDFGTGSPDELVILTPAPRTAVVTKRGDSLIVRVSPPKNL